MKHCICTVAPGGPSPPCDLKVLRAWSRLVGAGQQLAGQERPSRWARAPVGECAPGRPPRPPLAGAGVAALAHDGRVGTGPRDHGDLGDHEGHTP